MKVKQPVECYISNNINSDSQLQVAALILVSFAALAGAEIVSHVDTPHVTYDTHHADHPTPAVAYTKPAYKEDYSYVRIHFGS